jgi:hypothetical protein
MQQTRINDEANLYLVIVGANGQTKELSLPNNKKSKIEFRTIDVGKVGYILIESNFLYIFIQNRFQKFFLDNIKITIELFGMLTIS